MPKKKTQIINNGSDFDGMEIPDWDFLSDLDDEEVEVKEGKKSRRRKRSSSKGLNDSGSVFFREGRKKGWVCQITIDGKIKQWYFLEEKEADKFRRKTLYELHEKGLKPPDKKQTVYEYVSSWLETKISITDNVRETYTGHINRHIKDDPLGSMKLGEVEPKHIREFIRAKSKHGYSGAYIQDILIPLNQAFNIAVSDETIQRNPMTGIEKPSRKKTAGKAMTIDEVKRFLATVRQDKFASRQYALFTICFITGLRPSEIVGLRWRSVNWEESTIRIDQSIRRVTGKGLLSGPTKTASGYRTIPLAPENMALLRQHKSAQD
jgi:integrase